MVDRLLKARRKNKREKGRQSGRQSEQIKKGWCFWDSLLTMNISCVTMEDTSAADAGAGDGGKSGLAVRE